MPCVCFPVSLVDKLSLSSFISRLPRERGAAWRGRTPRTQENVRSNALGCQNQWNYCRRFCKSFTNPTQATSSQRSFVNLELFLSSLLLSALFLGGHRVLTPCGILAVGFPKVTLLLQGKHPRGCAPTKANSIARGYTRCKTGKRMYGRIDLLQAICCLNKFESSPSFPFVPNR